MKRTKEMNGKMGSVKKASSPGGKHTGTLSKHPLKGGFFGKKCKNGCV